MLQDILERYRSVATLRDIIEIGLENENEASQVVTDLLADLTVQTDQHVLIAIDDFNLLFGPTSYFYLGRNVRIVCLLYTTHQLLFSPQYEICFHRSQQTSSQ